VNKTYPEIFLKCFNRVIGHEGKFTLNPKDPGNWTKDGVLKGTKFGLSARSYPDLDIKNLTAEDAKIEYYKFFLSAKLSKFSDAMKFQIFDAAFNHGFKWAAKILQRSVGAKDDGFIGMDTMVALSRKSEDDQLLLFLAQRTLFYTDLTHFNEFGKGWTRRIANNLIYASKDN
jgi:lysozyme family protein